jgi:hypothetical protein
MSDAETTSLEDMKFDTESLFREEKITDMKMGAIRVLVPVKVDGSEDPSRSAEYSGQTQIMTQSGPVPLEFPIEAASLAAAIEAFAPCASQAVEKMIEEVKEMQRREASRIVVPGQGGGGMPGMPGAGGGGGGGFGGGIIS